MAAMGSSVSVDDDSIETMIRFSTEFITRVSSIPVQSLFNESNSGNFLKLPKITPFSLQSRFCVVDGCVDVMLRASYFDLRDAIREAHNAQATEGLYVTGPIGVGKSFLLYLFAAEYRMSRAAYITYINDCSLWRNDPIQYLVKELVVSFGWVESSELDIPKMAEDVRALFVRGKNTNGALRDMIQKIYSYVCKTGLRWFVVIDQLNALYSVVPVAHEFPFNIIDVLNIKAQVTVVLSASENNEGYPLKLKKYGTYAMSCNRYVEDEYSQWCRQNGYDPENHIMDEAYFWSGGVPLELDEFHRTDAESSEEKLAKFVSNRILYIGEIHTKFVDKIATSRRITNLIDCIVRLRLDIEPPPLLTGMDKQLMCIISGKICALNPLCHEVLLECHPQHIQEPLDYVTSSVLSDETNYTNDRKGRILENYLISMIKVQKEYYFSAQMKVGRKIKNSTFSGKISKVVWFQGKSLPTASLFSKGQTTLFVPIISNYPSLDYFIWESKEKKLFAVQVTVCRPMSKHEKPNADLLSEWAKFFQVPETLILWVVPSVCVTEKCMDSIGAIDYIVKLESLAHRYPAVTNLRLRSAEEERSLDLTDEAAAGGGRGAAPRSQPRQPRAAGSADPSGPAVLLE